MMNLLVRIVRDPTFIAHGVGILGVVGTALAGVSPVFGAIIAALTAVFHIAQTFGNGTALPPGWSKSGVTTDPKPDRSSAVSLDGAAFGQPHVDGPAPKLPILNASGDTEIQP